MGRIPFRVPAHLLPPFLPPSISVDPFTADSIVRYDVDQRRETSENFDDTGRRIGTDAEQRLVIPPGGLGHIVLGDPVPQDVSTHPDFRPGSFIAATGEIPFRGGVHGDIAYRGERGWVLLPANTAGRVLKTQGGGAGPRWQDA